MTLRIRVEAAALIRKLRKAGANIKPDMQAAGIESLDEVLDTVGVRAYPPETDANHPPVPYYIRGQGMQTAGGNLDNSEKYGMAGWSKNNYMVKPYGAEVTNPTTYGVFLGGEQQPAAMGAIGWRKLSDVAKEKTKAVTVIFEKWIKRGLRKAGLL